MAVVTVDELVGSYRESSDSRWLALAFLAAQCTPDQVSAASECALREGGASRAHALAARELGDLLEVGLCRG